MQSSKKAFVAEAAGLLLLIGSNSSARKCPSPQRRLDFALLCFHLQDV